MYCTRGRWLRLRAFICGARGLARLLIAPRLEFPYCSESSAFRDGRTHTIRVRVPRGVCVRPSKRKPDRASCTGARTPAGGRQDARELQRRSASRPNHSGARSGPGAAEAGAEARSEEHSALRREDDTFRNKSRSRVAEPRLPIYSSVVYGSKNGTVRGTYDSTPVCGNEQPMNRKGIFCIRGQASARKAQSVAEASYHREHCNSASLHRGTRYTVRSHTPQPRALS